MKLKDYYLERAITDLTFDSCMFNNIAGTSDDYSKQALENQLKLILSEVQELVDAFNGEAPINVAAEAVDVAVTTIGLLQKLNNAGIDIQEVTKRIGVKNLEKFPLDITEVNRTVSDYESKGVKTTVSSTNTDGITRYVIRDTNGKVRKPIGFTSVNLNGLTPINLKYGFVDKQ